jgi:hypothetical protein
MARRTNDRTLGRGAGAGTKAAFPTYRTVLDDFRLSTEYTIRH